MLYISARYIVWNRLTWHYCFGEQKLGGRCSIAQHHIIEYPVVVLEYSQNSVYYTTVVQYTWYNG